MFRSHCFFRYRAPVVLRHRRVAGCFSFERFSFAFSACCFGFLACRKSFFDGVRLGSSLPRVSPIFRRANSAIHGGGFRQDADLGGDGIDPIGRSGDEGRGGSRRDGNSAQVRVPLCWFGADAVGVAGDHRDDRRLGWRMVGRAALAFMAELVRIVQAAGETDLTACLQVIMASRLGF